MSEKGTTITELMVSVAIAALLVGLMALGLQAMVDRVNLEAATSELVGDLRYARTLAIWERQPIQVALDTGQLNVTLFRRGDRTQPVQTPRSLTSRGIRSIHSSAGTALSFSPAGTSATPTTVTLEGRNGDRRMVMVSLTGVVRAR
jgi:Tfp pilus assembly protein FimT